MARIDMNISSKNSRPRRLFTPATVLVCPACNQNSPAAATVHSFSCLWRNVQTGRQLNGQTDDHAFGKAGKQKGLLTERQAGRWEARQAGRRKGRQAGGRKGRHAGRTAIQTTIGSQTGKSGLRQVESHDSQHLHESAALW